jgi:hypothetical protein
VASKAGERHARRRIGAAKGCVLGIGRVRQLGGHAVEIKAGLVDVAELQPAVGQRAQQLAAAMLSQLAPPGRAGGHHKLEVADCRSGHTVRFGTIERPRAARERQQSGSARYADGDVVRRQGYCAIHVGCRLRRQGLALGDRAALERLDGQEQPPVAPPHQRLRMIRIGRQRVGDQLHGAIERRRVAIHAREHVLANLEVEALLGEDGEARRQHQHDNGDQAHGTTSVERRARRSRLASQPMPTPATMPPTAPDR